MYPISYEADFNPEPDRWLTFFRLILAIPWFIVAAFWGILFFFTHLIAWIALIVLGRYPAGSTSSTPGSSATGSASRPGSSCRPTSGRRSGCSDDPSYPIRVNVAAGRPSARAG